jgi:hypothetical protein
MKPETRDSVLQSSGSAIAAQALRHNAGYDAAWVCFIGVDPERDLQDGRPSDHPQ